MKSLVLILSYLFLLFGCNQKQQKESTVINGSEVVGVRNDDSVKNYYSYKLFDYEIDNRDTCKFSYVSSDLVDGGIRVIQIKEDYCFLLDEVHKNIKRINLTDGTIVCGEVLSGIDGIYLIDMLIFKDNIYVSTRRDKLYILNLDMRVIDSSIIATDTSHDIYFKGVKDGNILAFISLNDTLLEISPKGIVVGSDKVSPSVGHKLAFNTYYSPNKESAVRFNKYLIEEKNDEQMFISESHRIKLTKKFNDLSDTNLHGFNMDFNDKYFVYFEVADSSIYLHVYNRE